MLVIIICIIAAIFTAASPFIFHFICYLLDRIQSLRSDILDKYDLPNLPYLFIFLNIIALLCWICHLFIEN